MSLILNKYKYNPDDFKGLLNLSDDLNTFYELFERYKNSDSQDDWYYLLKHWGDLFFTIKHREVEGFLDPVTANDIRGYLEALLYD